MALTALEIIQVIERAKELGFTQIKVEGVELGSQVTPALAPAASQMPVPELEAKDIINPLSVLDEMDEDEVLYWATPYYDELMAKKEAQKQVINQE